MDSPPAQSNGDESLPYGFGDTRSTLKALNTALRRRDPKGQCARIKDSSFGRRKANLLRTVSKRELLKELLRREAEEQRRASGRERKARWRMRQDLKQAVEAAEDRVH